MLSRRTFVADATVVFVLAPVAVGCGSDDGGDNACGGAGAASSVADGHSHSLCVPSADLINPPSAGFSYTTSSDDGHTHAVALSATDLQNLAGGRSVDVTSSPVGGHTHDFTLAMQEE